MIYKIYHTTTSNILFVVGNLSTENVYLHTREIVHFLQLSDADTNEITLESSLCDIFFKIKCIV